MFVKLGKGDFHQDEGWKSATCGSRQMAPDPLTDLQLQHRSLPRQQGEERELDSV